MSLLKFNREQKFRLIALLEEQGFNDPFIISEMLDRFENESLERIQADPSLPVTDAFTLCMKEAHRVFSIPGNYAIKSYYEQIIKKRYKAFYRNQQKKMLISPVYIALILLTALVVFMLYYWANGHFEIYGRNGMAILLFVLWLSATFFLAVKFTLKRKPSMVLSAIAQTNDYWMIFLIFIMLPMHTLDNVKVLMIAAAINALLWPYFIINFLSKYTTLKEAYNHHLAVIYDYWKNRNVPLISSGLP